MKVITLSLLQYLADNGFGAIDDNLFWEKLGIGKDGLYITDLGGSQSRTTAHYTTYEIYSRAKDDLTAYIQLLDVANFLTASYGVCTLPAATGFTDEGFDHVTIMPPSTVANMGQDANGRVIYSITGQVYYSDGYSAKDPPTPPPSGSAISTESEQPILTENNKIITTEENNGSN